MKRKIILSLLSLFGVCLLVFLFGKNNSAYNFQVYIEKLMPPPGSSLDQLAKSMEWSVPAAERNKSMASQAMRDELTFQEVRKDILVPLQRAISFEKNPNLANFFQHDADIAGLIQGLSKIDRSFDGIDLYKWLSQSKAEKTPVALAEYFKQFSQIKDCRFDITNYFVDIQDRTPDRSEILKMKLGGYYDIRGLSLANQMRTDRGPVEFLVEKQANAWKIKAIHFGNLETLVSNRKPAFEEVTAQAFSGTGPDVHLRREAIRRGGYALAVTDYNNDGKLDIYVGGAANSTLWKGLGNGKFEKVAVPDFDKETMVKTAIFADFQNSGNQDLFVTSFNPNGGQEDLVIYKNDGAGGFKRIGDPTKGMGRLSSYYPMPATAADFNGDGLLDVYVGFPGKKDFTFLDLDGHEISGGAKAVQGLFINKGNLAFNEQEMKMPSMKEGARQYLYPHSALAVDFDKDKNVDLVVIDDQDNLSPVYRNKGNAQFEQIAEKIGLADSTNAMSVAAADFNNDGLMDFAITSVNMFAAQRFENAMTNMWQDDGFTTGLGGQALRLFQQSPNGKFVEVTKSAGLGFAGEGAAGVEFVDYNNDGLVDIFLTNGLWSGDDAEQDASHLLIFGKNNKLIHEDILKDRTANTQSDFMSFLIGFRGDLFKPDYKGEKTVSAAGYQRKRLFRNNGDGTFTEVAYLEGVDSINDGYIVAKADLYGTGRQDLILRNGDPGQESHKFPVVQIFKNNFDKNNSLQLKLIGHSINRDAIGVGATVEVDGKKYYQQVLANNGPAQSERILHFGIGTHAYADKVTIHWPNGDQVLKQVTQGRHVIEQPVTSNVAKD